MIESAELLAACRQQGIEYFVGVPDSLLKDFCEHLSDNVEEGRHIICANEGNAIGLAAGWYLGSGRPALVYMQNSGFGNSINPLLSLADSEVYGIPMLLIVGWRGAPESKDEPQHVKQGRVMSALLRAIEIPHFILDAAADNASKVIVEACDAMRNRMTPVVILVKPGTFTPVKSNKKRVTGLSLSREDAIKMIVDTLDANDLIVSTTGKASRELYEYRRSRGDGGCQDFMTVGSMGHASSIAMGLSSALGDRRVICLDGDGSLLMHMGSMAIIGQKGPANLVHIVLNNGAHESVGGQPTVGLEADFVGVAESCGYKRAVSVTDAEGVRKAIEDIQNVSGPSLIEVRVNLDSRSDLLRPKESPVESRKAFMKGCSSSERR